MRSADARFQIHGEGPAALAQRRHARRAVPAVKRSAELGRRLLPLLAGQPIRVVLRKSLGPHLAATSIPRRVILLDAEVLARSGEFERILVHELFHFAWVRLSNRTRRSWEDVISSEILSRVPGELGWSSEWRKRKLTPADVRRRSPAWRRYACESFCDTSAWLYSGLSRHPEFTLSATERRLRRTWFVSRVGSRPIPV